MDTARIGPTYPPNWPDIGPNMSSTWASTDKSPAIAPLYPKALGGYTENWPNILIRFQTPPHPDPPWVQTPRQTSTQTAPQKPPPNHPQTRSTILGLKCSNSLKERNLKALVFTYISPLKFFQEHCGMMGPFWHWNLDAESKIGGWQN